MVSLSLSDAGSTSSRARLLRNRWRSFESTQPGWVASGDPESPRCSRTSSSRVLAYDSHRMVGEVPAAETRTIALTVVNVFPVLVST